MSNLENLRKQAKQIVRWHRDRVWTVAEVTRTNEEPPTVSAPLFSTESSGGSRPLAIVIVALIATLVLAFVGYEVFLAPSGTTAWTPPAGVTREDTPAWLQSLCADQTPELCAAAERARQPQECESMRAALDHLRALERELSARGRVSAKQHWVLVELYGQGRELCQYEVSAEAASSSE